MIALSTAYLAIASAAQRNVLRFEACVSRNGDDYIAICDEAGIIECAATGKEAEQTVRDAVKAAHKEWRCCGCGMVTERSGRRFKCVCDKE